MYVARWVLISAVLLAAFQAWLWAGQQSMAGLAIAVALAIALIAAVHLPGTRYAEALQSTWTLPRGAGESERRYRFKVAIAWLVVVGVCVVGCVVLNGLTTNAEDGISLVGIGLRVFGFAAGLMSLQSFLMGMFRSSAQPSGDFMSTLVIKRVWIEKSECTGHMLCIPEAPDSIEFDHSDRTSVVRQRSLGYTQQELALLLAASEVCPMRAFRIETEDGRIHSVPDDKPVREALKKGNYRWFASATPMLETDK